MYARCDLGRHLCHGQERLSSVSSPSHCLRYDPLQDRADVDLNRYAFICFGGAGVWIAVPIFLSWTITMFDGREKRSISIALINGFGQSKFRLA